MHDLNASLRYAPCRASAALFICFAGMQLYRSPPHYEWAGATSAYAINRLFVRDNHQYWYIRGLADIADGVPDCVRNLRHFIDENGIRSVACFGASSGGYAALLYGHWLGATEVHAFSPLTKLPGRRLHELYRLIPSRNWKLARRTIQLHLDRSYVRRDFDLHHLSQTHNGRSRYHIYYGNGHPLDRRHATRLAGLPGVELHAYDFS